MPLNELGLYSPRESVILRSKFPEPAVTGISNLEALNGTMEQPANIAVRGVDTSPA